jgi:hypothetical protein
MRLRRLSIGLLLMFPLACGARVDTGQEVATGLRYWEWDADGVLFRLTQRLPDQTRAFFLARGFDAQSADLFATNCVFQSLFKNARAEGGDSLRFDLRDWRIHANGTERRLKVRDHWDEVWASRGLPEAAQIAFEWSLLPTQQEYAPGDYNWGMTSYGLAPGVSFDLAFSWTSCGKVHHGLIEGVQCSPDIHPEAGAPAQ